MVMSECPSKAVRGTFTAVPVAVLSQRKDRGLHVHCSSSPRGGLFGRLAAAMLGVSTTGY